MNAYAIRHGRAELNKIGYINGFLDDELCEEGIKQAKIATTLIPEGITHIYASPLLRVRQTAGIINERFLVPISYHDELKEVNFGVLNGTPYLPEYRRMHETLDFDWRPSGECVEDVKARLLSILKIIEANHDDGEVLIVAHGGIIRLMHYLEKNELIDGRVENASLHTFNLKKILDNHM